jgi:hypothetical protein
MSTEFFIGTMLSIIGIIASVLSAVNIVTINKLKGQIIRHLMRHSIRTVDDVDEFVIRAIIDYICDEHKKRPVDIVKVINGLIYEYDNLPIRTDDTRMIKARLLELIRETTTRTIERETRIETKENGTTTETRESPPRRRRQNTIHDYLVDFCAQLKDDTSYDLHTLRDDFFKVLQDNGKLASKSGLLLDITYATVNNKNRYWHRAPNPENDRLFVSDSPIKSSMLLYLPDESNRRTVKKFTLQITDNPTIYWRGRNGEREEIKWLELKKKVRR